MRTRKTRYLLVFVCLLALFVLYPVLPASAEGPVLMKPPAKDAAVVVSMPGLPIIPAKNLLRDVNVGPEGLVIRQSHVKDGKIIIPPAGLYYDIRVSLGRSLLNDPILLLGKIYTLVDTGNHLDVKKNFTLKPGERALYGDGSHALECSISTSFFSLIPEASFKILKPSGNYFGAAFGPVTTNPSVTSAHTLAQGTKFPEGALSPDPASWTTVFHGSNVAVNELTYLVAKEVSKTQSTVLEWGAGAIDWVALTADKPIEATLGAGEMANLGQYKVKVVKVDAGAKTAEVQLLGADNKVLASKTLGPLNEQVLTLLPSDPVARETLILKHGDVQVGLDAFRNPFKGDKVALLGYTGVFKIDNAAPWKDDPRFLLRPDT